MKHARMATVKRAIVSLWLLSIGALPAVAAPNGSGPQAVQIAQSQLGVLCQDVTLPGYHVWGRHTNGCADLVAAVEAQAGCYQPTPGDAWVATLEKALQGQGWRAVPRSEARPGDVAIFHDANGQDQHTEIVANNGATQLIGNNGSAQETVSYDSGDWGSPTFYTPARNSPRLLEVQLQQAQAQVETLETQVRQVDADRSRLRVLASNAQQWYQEGAISKRQAESIQQQSKELSQRAEALGASLAEARAQLADAAGPLKVQPSLASSSSAPVAAASDASYWQNLYEQGAIPRSMLEQHLKQPASP